MKNSKISATEVPVNKLSNEVITTILKLESLTSGRFAGRNPRIREKVAVTTRVVAYAPNFPFFEPLKGVNVNVAMYV